MEKKVNIVVPPSINFAELGIHKDENGKIKYSVSCLNELLDYNNVNIDELTQDAIEILLLEWYVTHRRNGGLPDVVFESMINAVSEQPLFDVKIFWEVVKEPPTPQQIREFRKHTGLTQAQTAKLLNVSSKQLISDYETGKKSPNRQTYTLWLLLTNQHPTLQLSNKQFY